LNSEGTLSENEYYYWDLRYTVHGADCAIFGGFFFGRISVIWAELSVKSVHSADSKKVMYIKWFLWFQIGWKQCLNPPFYSAYYFIVRMDKMSIIPADMIFLFIKIRMVMIYPSIRNFVYLKQRYAFGVNSLEYNIFKMY
jgi:hypothetical protein